MQPKLSFEFFPPKDIAGSFRLWDAAQGLLPFAPAYVSVTYGAGGSTRALTHETVEALRAQGTEVAAHLTCVGATREETLEIAERYRAAGVTRIVALRGDAPEGARFAPAAGGFASSVELVRALVERGFDVTVGAYPERHPEAAHDGADLDFLARKFEAGADSAITQFFFSADTYLSFRDACIARGLPAPIPGILPIHNWAATQRMAAQCGASVPPTVAQAFEVAERDGRLDLLRLTQASTLAQRLIEEGAEHLHLYTLNRAGLTRDVCRALGFRETPVPLRRAA
ncbi:MAG: methylenetetrahydrofolate reductase [Shimia sp.]